MSSKQIRRRIFEKSASSAEVSTYRKFPPETFLVMQADIDNQTESSIKKFQWSSIDFSFAENKQWLLFSDLKNAFAFTNFALNVSSLTYVFNRIASWTYLIYQCIIQDHSVYNACTLTGLHT